MDRNPLKRIRSDDIPAPSFRMSDPEAEKIAAEAVGAVTRGGVAELRRRAEQFDGLASGSPLVIDALGLDAALGRIGDEDRRLLERAAARISAFAQAQKTCLADLDMPIPGGRAGHRFIPVARAGCYVPGGRYPLPSSALMTVCAARAAGVGEVWCAGPRPADLTLAAARIAGACGFLAAGGAHAVAALALGVGVPECDVVAGPGGRYVAAAKRLLYGTVGADAPAGPSELLVIAESGADPALIAADLLAQAEHDPAAVPALVALDGDLAEKVEAAVASGLEALPEPNHSTAAAALGNGWILVADDFETACAASNRFAPEHLEIMAVDPARYERRCACAGAVFLGAGSAEVLGDYGAGPNHCLPTGGASRFAAGLSVLTFLRARTWLEMDESPNSAILAVESAAFGRLEGLEGHARAADIRATHAGAGAGGAGAGAAQAMLQQ